MYGAVALLLYLSLRVESQAVILNPSFEVGVTTTTWISLDYQVSDWPVCIGCRIIRSSNGDWGGLAAPDGLYYMGVQTNTEVAYSQVGGFQGTAAQTITLPAFGVTTISFSAATRPGMGGAGSTVMWNGVSEMPFSLTTAFAVKSLSIATPNGAWTAEFKFITTSAGCNDCTAHYDNFVTTLSC